MMVKIVVDITDDGSDTLVLSLDEVSKKLDLREAAHLAAELAVGVALKVERVSPRVERVDNASKIKWQRMGLGTSNYQAISPEGVMLRVYREGTGWHVEVAGQLITPEPLAKKHDAQELASRAQIAH